MTAQALTTEDIQPLVDEIAQLKRAVQSLTPKPEPMTVQEYAKLRGVSEATVRRWCIDGKISAERAGDKVWRIYSFLPGSKQEDPAPAHTTGQRRRLAMK